MHKGIGFDGETNAHSKCCTQMSQKNVLKFKIKINCNVCKHE